MGILGLQHMFAMFGSTVLVPAITGLSVSATLLFAGIGTLLFHLITKFKVPAFLGSSFAFIGGYAAVVQMGAASGLSAAQALPYACAGVLCAAEKGETLGSAIKLGVASAAASLSEANATDGMRSEAEVRRLYAELR